MQYDVPQVDTRLSKLVDTDNPYQDYIIMQAPKTNTEDIFFGPNNDVSHFLEPGKSTTLPVKALSSYSVRADAGGQELILTTI